MALFGGMSSTTVLPMPRIGGVLSGAGGLSVDGTKVAITGRVWFPGRTGTKEIERVELLMSSSDISGGSGVTLSLQDPLLTDFVPDETQDETVDIPNSDLPAAPEFGWVITGPFGSPSREVSFGDLLSVVIEWDASGRQGTDVVGLGGVSGTGLGVIYSAAAAAKVSGGTWAHSIRIPSLALKFTDGTYGTLYGCVPCSAMSQIAISPSFTYDEYGLQFVMPRDFHIDGADWFINFSSDTGDGELRLYRDGVATALATVALDAHQQPSIGAGYGNAFKAFSAIAGSAWVVYRLVVKATTASSISLLDIVVNHADHWSLHMGGSSWHAVGRQGGGAWTEIPLQRPLVWPLIAGM